MDCSSSVDDTNALHVVVATHGHCFDGLCSAALFTRLMRHVHAGRALRFSYHALGYAPGSKGVDPKLLGGDINAVLDFRFTPASSLTWYFDHHVSAFPDPGDRSTYEAHVEEASLADRRMFHDAAYGSCTKLIAEVGATHFGLDPAPVASLVHWGDLVDRAAYPSAESTLRPSEPELQLATVVANLCDDNFLTEWVPKLLEEPLVEIAQKPVLAAAYTPLLHAQELYIERVRSRAMPWRNVVLVDLSEKQTDVVARFLTYALYPESMYSVVLTRSHSRCKISIGFNPWSPLPRTHNIAALCEQHGGGGHPVVGSIALPASEISQARALAVSLTQTLAEPPTL